MDKEVVREKAREILKAAEGKATPESQSRFTRDGLVMQCLRILQQIDAPHYRSLSDAACIFGAVNIAAFIRTRDAEREIEIRKGGLDALLDELEKLADRWTKLGNDSCHTKLPGKPDGQPTPAGGACLVLADDLHKLISKHREGK